MPREFPDLDVPVPEMTPAEMKQRLDDSETFTLLDTRQPEEYEVWHITHPNLSTINIPFMEFLDESGEKPAATMPDGVPDGPLVTTCAKGISSRYVAAFLQREGQTALALEDGMEGWAALYEHHSVPTNWADADVIQFHRPSSGCLSVLCIAGDEAAVIDPLRAFADEYERVASDHGATLEYAIDTHVHADHVSGVREVAAKTGAEVVMPTGATERGLDFESWLLEGGETLSLGDTEITAHALPGHTTEMMGYAFAGVLAAGDSIFLDGVARPDLEDEDEAIEAAGTLWETLQTLKGMDEELVVAPGHAGPTTTPDDTGAFTATLGELRETLQAFEESKDEFVDRITSNLPPQPSNYQQIIDINLGRDAADSQEFFELELGPNNCAVAD